MLSEPEPIALMNATHDVLAEELGHLERNIPDEMARALDENIFLFSGFKTYHEMTDASRLLRDADRGFKSFDRFLQDVQAIDASYNRNWLYAEYNFATASTQMAARWADIERDGDEYDLQYRTAMDGLVRPEHAALEGITLPPSDKFWNEYYPPNGWNCRCTAVQVLKDKYPTSDSDQACAAGERATTQIGKNGENKAAMFRFNPGKAGKVFPPKHPYLPKGCGDCSFNKLAYNPKSEKCIACKEIYKITCKAKGVKVGGKQYGKDWCVELPETEKGGYIVKQDGHGANEAEQNKKSATPLAEAGFRVELIKQRKIRVDSLKKWLKTHDAFVDDEKWEFKFTKDYQNLTSSIGTKAGEAVVQGADVLLIDIVRTNRFSTKAVVDGVGNSFYYNPSLQKICVMIESKRFVIIGREKYDDGTYKSALYDFI